MKRLIAIPLILILALSGCTGVSRLNPERFELPEPLTFTAEITEGDSCVTARFTRNAADSWEITLLAPSALKDMTIAYTKEQVVVQFAGGELETGVLDSEVHALAPYRMVIDAFENAATGDGREIIAYSGEVQVTARTEAGLYELTLDRETMSPKSLNLREAGVTVVMK